MEKLHIHKLDTWFRNLSPWRKRVGGREKERQLGTDEMDPIGKNWGVNLRMLKWSDPLEGKCTGWEGVTWQSRLSWRISIYIEIWEHHLGKVWNQHLALKQLEYHNSTQNKGLACKISRNKHMIEISSEVFMVGPTGSIVQHHHVQGSAHDIEASSSQHSQGLFKTQRDQCKTNRG